jgi:hypothetical protein
VRARNLAPPYGQDMILSDICRLSVFMDKAEQNERTDRIERDRVLAIAYIKVAIQVIMDDSTMIRAACDTLDDRM